VNQQFRHRQFPAGNPLANVLVVIAGLVVLSLSLALGFFVFIAVASFVLVMAATMSVRNWWLRRRFGQVRGRPAGGRDPGGRRVPQTIDGEYREVRPDNERPTGGNT